MTDYLKISVVTPSYNQDAFLEQTIMSVLGQHYPALEYFVMDGGSSDQSPEIIKKYSSQLAHWTSEKDNGQGDAINKGFLKATGDVLLWLNSDDMLLPNVLHEMNSAVRQQGSGIYFGNCIHFQEYAGVKSWGSDVAGQSRKTGLEEADYIIQPSSFWTRDVLERVGPLNEQYHFTFDWEWFLRARQLGIPFFPIAKPLSLYRFHSSHKTGTGGDKRLAEVLAIYKAFNPSKAGLFELLMEEEIKRGAKPAPIWRWGSRLLNKPLTYGHTLRMMKYGKYKNYSARDIDTLSQML